MRSELHMLCFQAASWGARLEPIFASCSASTKTDPQSLAPGDIGVCGSLLDPKAAAHVSGALRNLFAACC